ncbi:MAG: hypothetical protein DI624_04055 [Brevundimonas sp.]|uniref:hypothetical protein n=1 Tax=Brevundimonas sp. TaxID=1871086 RepID=UPI000DB3CF19|nr:hypothetical protein [Brevundimonas sp.]PZT99853.1 MAG: hypothetical protein DI624_04055 [Brevundimonas sp.]
MDDTEKELAEEIVHTLPNDVSELIVAQAMERVRALQTAAHSLDQRVTQVAALQFAAAALSASVEVEPFQRWLFGIAALAFVVGGCVAFRGIRSDAIQLPGIAPVWWRGALVLTTFTQNDARSWAAGAIQTAITQIDVENCERAKHLNTSLWYAVGGAAALAIAGGLRIFVPDVAP